MNLGNILSLAMSVIPPQAVTREPFVSRTENAAGDTIPTYGPAEPLEGGSVQPIPQRLYQALGLDFDKKYVTLYTRANVVTVGRNSSGDRITYNGERFLCESATDWLGQAGWVAVVAVRVP